MPVTPCPGVAPPPPRRTQCSARRQSRAPVSPGLPHSFAFPRFPRASFLRCRTRQDPALSWPRVLCSYGCDRSCVALSFMTLIRSQTADEPFCKMSLDLSPLFLTVGASFTCLARSPHGGRGPFSMRGRAGAVPPGPTVMWPLHLRSAGQGQTWADPASPVCARRCGVCARRCGVSARGCGVCAPRCGVSGVPRGG